MTIRWKPALRCTAIAVITQFQFSPLLGDTGLKRCELPEASIQTIKTDYPLSKPVDRNGIRKKVLCGYQAWFFAKGDGNPYNRWQHWGKDGSVPPRPGNLVVEVYPDIREYEKLYGTGFDDFPDGRTDQLYSCYDEQTVDTHFKWMSQYGIDGVALQRFNVTVRDAPKTLHKALENTMKAAEKDGRVFYICYGL